MATDTVIESYSSVAEQYDDVANQESFWGRWTSRFCTSIDLRDYRTVLEVGCGTGNGLVELASRASKAVRFIGIEPAAAMRERARDAAAPLSNVTICDG